MSRLPKQTKRGDLIKGLRKLGFEGPFTGTGKHPEFMSRGDHDVRLPNDHSGDIREPLLKKILQQAGIAPEDWMSR